MKSITYLLYVLFCFVLLTSCGAKLDTVLATKKDLYSYKTFAYLPNSNFEGKDIDYTSKYIEKSLIEAVNENMKQQGYVLDRKNPDLLVLIRKTSDTGVAIDTEKIYASYPYTEILPVSPYYEPYYYYDYGTTNLVVGYDSEMNINKEVTLAVDLIDRQTKELVWRGTIKDEFDKINNTDALTGYIHKLFGMFGTDTLASY